MRRGLPCPLLIDPQIILAFPNAFIPAKGLGFHVVPPLSWGLTDLPLAHPRVYTASLFLPFARSLCRALVGLVSLRPALADLAALPVAPASEPAAPALLEREEA